MDMEERCRVCNQTRRWHAENKPVHEFSLDSGRPQRPAPPEASNPRLAGDIVLRLTMMQKGLITEAELNRTRQLLERAIELNAAVVVEPSPSGGFRLMIVSREELVDRFTVEQGARP
jgi:hypothetical protein